MIGTVVQNGVRIKASDIFKAHDSPQGSEATDACTAVHDGTRRLQMPTLADSFSPILSILFFSVTIFFYFAPIIHHVECFAIQRCRQEVRSGVWHAAEVAAASQLNFAVVFLLIPLRHIPPQHTHVCTHCI